MPDIADFERYARWLARKYHYMGNGADEEDVAQEARIAAWRAINEYRPGAIPLRSFVKERMERRVLDFVRLRFTTGQRRFERDADTMGEWDASGHDVTSATVIVRDELDRAVKAVNDLPPCQRRYLKGRINGLSWREIDPARRGSISASVLIARRRVAAALAA